MQTVNLGNVKGPKGADGKGATVQIGTVAVGANASVVNSGTSTDAVFDFVFPKAAYTLPAATASALGGVKSGGGITVDASGNVTLNTTVINNLINTAITAYAQKEHPVGDVLITYNNVNPGTRLGFGTWTQIAQGRTLVGVNTGDSDFSSAGKTGGSKTFKLTEENIAYRDYGIIAADGIFSRVHDHKNAYTDVSHLPPYFCVYFWRRTA